MVKYRNRPRLSNKKSPRDWGLFEAVEIYYSERNATTGSLFAAILAGTSPAINVRQILSTISASACKGLRSAILVIVTLRFLTASRLAIIRLIGIESI